MRLTIATYHYVRDTADTAYPCINALGIDAFKGQIAYLQKHHTIVSAADVIACARDPERPLGPRPALLTFDDGYRDHFDFVFPILREAGIRGAFFPPAATVVEKRVLDVNKIHFVLALTQNPTALVSTLNGLVDEFRSQHALPTAKEHWHAWAKPGRWDPAEIIYVKRMLQKGLPATIRAKITDRIFREIVTNDESDFAAQLYMSKKQLTTLLDGGMYIGNHGYAHNWLNSLSAHQQEEDIDRALGFLAGLGVDLNDWMMCYPYGGYDETLLAMLRRKNCAVGLTVTSEIAELGDDEPLTLPRIDTNDLPNSAGAPISPWTQKIIPPAHKERT